MARWGTWSTVDAIAPMLSWRPEDFTMSWIVLTDLSGQNHLSGALSGLSTNNAVIVLGFHNDTQIT